jgi:hypothetical protein
MPARRLLIAAAATLAGAVAAPAPASAATTWLCRPGMAKDPCAGSLTTTRVAPNGKRLGIERPRRDRPQRIDCFYVYPTVSDEPGLQASFTVRPELRSIARFQAARYSQHCRVFAPVYRQITLAGLNAPIEQITPVALTAYADVRAAWRDYVRRYNKGRGVVLVGHSQGAAHLTRLVRDEIDAKPAMRKRLVSAILLGGNVTVRRGSDVGGDFRHVRACRSAKQLHCVMAFSTYDQTPPPDAAFGRPNEALNMLSGTPAREDLQVLCTNPAALGGGTARLDPIFPGKPFAPGTTIALGIALAGEGLPHASTPFVSAPGAYTGHCSNAGGASVLRIRAVDGAPVLKASPTPAWGLHLADGNIALGDLVKVVGREAKEYARVSARRR